MLQEGFVNGGKERRRPPPGLRGDHVGKELAVKHKEGVEAIDISPSPFWQCLRRALQAQARRRLLQDLPAQVEPLLGDFAVLRRSIQRLNLRSDALNLLPDLLTQLSCGAARGIIAVLMRNQICDTLDKPIYLIQFGQDIAHLLLIVGVLQRGLRILIFREKLFQHFLHQTLQGTRVECRHIEHI